MIKNHSKRLNYKKKNIAYQLYSRRKNYDLIILWQGN